MPRLFIGSDNTFVINKFQMPSFNTKNLINNLQKDVQLTITQLEELKQLSEKQLLQQPSPDSWSIIQVLEHLNAYNRFYLNEVRAVNSKNIKSTSGRFKSGWLGNYFTNLMLPRENGKIAKKMSAPKDYTFSPQQDANKVIIEFQKGQQDLLELLTQSRSLNLNSKVSISLTTLIKLKLGDIFRFLIAHQIRHFLQIQNIKKSIILN